MIAIIPARGGSKGLPGKNIRKMCGKPLIAYTIECALKSKYIDRVIVSTDDDEIARISLKFGAEVAFMRPSHLASDTVLAVENYLYTIDRIEKEENVIIDRFIVLQPTSPLRSVEDIDCAVELFKKKNADSVVSYTKEEHPIYWHKNIDNDNRLINIFDDKIVNRQELRTTYYPNGAIYIFKSSLIRNKKYYTDNSFAYVMPRDRSVDIDFLEDFLYAEYLLKKCSMK